MKKKLSLIIAAAIVAVIAGATWAALVPSVGPFVALLEACAGYACGYFYRRELDANSIFKLSAEVEELKKTNEELVAAAQTGTVKISTVRKAKAKNN